MNRIMLVFASGPALGAMLLLATSAAANDYADLAALARSEKNSFQPTTRVDAELRASQCRTALDRLARDVNSLAEPERSARRDCLRLDELIEHLRRPQPDLRKIGAISKCFYAPQPGLESEAAVAARTALDDYVAYRHVVDGRSPQQVAQEYRERLEQAARILQSERIDHSRLREHVAWLAALRQAPRTVAGLRATFDQPNVVICVSHDVLPTLADRFEQQIARSNWTTNTILGRRVEGMAHFTGTTSGGLAPDRPEAEIQLKLAGVVRAPSSTAYAGNIRIRSRSETSVEATKTIHWDGQKLVAEPARATAATESTLTGADVSRRRLLRGTRLSRGIDNLIANAALRRASQSQGQARRQAAAAAAERIARQFDAMVSERLDELNREVAYYYTHPLIRVGMLPQSSGVAADSSLSLHFRFPGMCGLSAPHPPDETLKGDVNVYIHESAFPNLIQAYAGGDRWTDEFFARIQREAVGDNSIEMRIREDDERWSLTLDRMHPWSTQIDRQGLRFTLRASAFSLQGKQYELPLEVHSVFVPVREVGPIFGWERIGDVQIDAPAGLDPEERDFLDRKLSGFFMERFFLDGLSAPAGGAWDTVSTMPLSNLQLADGWLQMEFTQLAESK